MIKMGERGLKKNKIKIYLSSTTGGWAVMQEKMKTNTDKRIGQWRKRKEPKIINDGLFQE